MRVLIAFGSRRGGTAGLARAVGEGLAQAGHQVDVRRASELDGLQAWEAVMVGGALYASRWHRHARRFVQRHVDELRHMPVWFFSSGPLDDSARQGELGPTRQVHRLMEHVHARGHATFGGRLEASAKGFVARALVRQGQAGDWRHLDEAKAWGSAVAGELSALPRRQGPVPAGYGRARRRVRRLLAGLCFFAGLTAAWGGIELFTWPKGGAPGFTIPLAVLEHTPFRDFFVPGLLLFCAVGLPHLLAGVQVLRRHRWGEVFAFGAGCALTVWILTEMALLRSIHWLHGLYLAVGLGTMAAALWLWRERRAAVQRLKEPPGG